MFCVIRKICFFIFKKGFTSLKISSFSNQVRVYDNDYSKYLNFKKDFVKQRSYTLTLSLKRNKLELKIKPNENYGVYERGAIFPHPYDQT